MQPVPRSSIAYSFAPKVVIWRPLAAVNGVLLDRLADPQLTYQEGKSPFFRTLVDGYGQYIPEPVINRYKGEQPTHGIVTFLRADLPECWTHVTVIEVGRGGSCLKVVPECLPDVDAYIAWRRQVADLYGDRSFNGAADIAASMPPCPGFPTTRQRLSVWLAGDDGYFVR